MSMLSERIRNKIARMVVDLREVINEIDNFSAFDEAQECIRKAKDELSNANCLITKAINDHKKG